tara:strand:+ start:335 stop:487 length:153 start_codon:yes stop_codon:yes gene_type:complete
MSKKFIRKPRKGKFARALYRPKGRKLLPVNQELTAEEKKCLEAFRERQKE